MGDGPANDQGLIGGSFCSFTMFIILNVSQHCSSDDYFSSTTKPWQLFQLLFLIIHMGIDPPDFSATDYVSSHSLPFLVIVLQFFWAICLPSLSPSPHIYVSLSLPLLMPCTKFTSHSPSLSLSFYPLHISPACLSLSSLPTTQVLSIIYLQMHKSRRYKS